jgi:hypothetical protein
MTDFAAEAKNLRDSMKGWGTNETKLLSTVCNKTENDLRAIAVEYSRQFQRDLLEDVKDETSGDFETVLCALLTPHYIYEASELYKAFKGLGTDEDRVTEILCTRTPEDIKTIAYKYAYTYHETLGSRLADETSGDLNTIYQALIQPRAHLDDAGIAAEVDLLKKIYAREPRGNGESDQTLISVMLSKIDRETAETIAREYVKATGQGLDELIKDKCSGDVETALLCLASPVATWLAAKLIKAFQAMGTDDNTVIRIICGQKEQKTPGLEAVAAQVKLQSGKPLIQWVKERCSGDEKSSLAMVVANFAGAVELA